MKLLFGYFTLAVVGALMSSCAEEVEVVQPAVNGTVTMKTTISLVFIWFCPRLIVSLQRSS